MSELLAAVYRGDQGRVDELLAQGPELDIFEAAAVGRAHRVEELLDADPGRVSAWTEDGFTPLHLAAFFRRPETARLLVERGALIDVVARNEQLEVTPLQSAAAAREEETAALLLERGADPNAQQREGSRRCTRPPSTATSPSWRSSWRTGQIRRWPPTTAAPPPTSRAATVTGSSLRVSRAAERSGRRFASLPRGHPGPPPAFDASDEMRARV